jgi:hypothetical protein
MTNDNSVTTYNTTLTKIAQVENVGRMTAYRWRDDGIVVDGTIHKLQGFYRGRYFFVPWPNWLKFRELLHKGEQECLQNLTAVCTPNPASTGDS